MEYTDIPFEDTKYLSKVRDYFYGGGFHSKEVNEFQFFYDKDINCIATISRRETGSILRILTTISEFDKIKMDLTKLVGLE